MKFSVNRKLLLQELRILTQVIERKATIPVLSFASLAVQGSTLTLMGTNLDDSLITEVPVSKSSKGATLVNARLLLQVALTAQSEVIDCEIVPNGKDPQLKITADKAEWMLETLTVDKFPNIPPLPGTPLALPLETFCSAAARVDFIAPRPGTFRFPIHGVHLDVNGSMTIVATDGHRLGVSTTRGIKGNLSGIVSLSALKVLRSIPRTEQELQIGRDATFFVFRSGNHTLISRAMAGTFPDYKMVIPGKAHKIKASFDAIAMTYALKQAGATVEKRSLMVGWVISVDGISAIASVNEGVGRFATSIVTNYRGDKQISLLFNLGYLLDICKRQTGIVNVKISNNHLDAVSFSTGDDCQYVVMPLRKP